MTMRPNLVFFHMDDQRFDTIRALGNSQIHTPNMDWLVSRGTSFTQACIPGGTCPAICMPSRAMLHSGNSLFHLQESGRTLPAEHVTLGETFRRAGYHTFASGKWHNDPASFNRSFCDGAEIFFGGMADHWNVPANDFDSAGNYSKRIRLIENPKLSNQTVELICDHIRAGKHSTDLIADATIEFLDHYPVGEMPFLAYLAFLAPHDPRSMPESFRKMYDSPAIDLPPNFAPHHPFDNGELTLRDEQLASSPRDPAEVRTHIAEYYAMITHLDHRIGAVINTIRNRGELENTIFILTSDHGLAVGQHGLMGKQNLYDHSIRIPLVMAGPGIEAGRVSHDQVYLMDLFPTLCEIINIEVPVTVEGQSFMAGLQGRPFAGRESLYLAYTDKQRGIRTRHYKLVECVVNGHHVMTQLFDLKNDPSEMNNLAPNSEHATCLRDLRKQLLLLREESGDLETIWGQTFWRDYPRI